MLTEDQISQVKQQIINQIKSTFPEDKKQEAIEKINSLDAQGLEAFLKQNQILQQKGESMPQECVFCSIIDKKIPSYEIGKNKTATAVLEINPISKSHALVIPKKHISSEKDLTKSTISLIEKVSKKITEKFKPKEIKTFYSTLFGHLIINLLPIYKNETTESKRIKISEQELKEIQEELTKKSIKKRPKKIVKKEKVKKKPEKLWLPKRIP